MNKPVSVTRYRIGATVDNGHGLVGEVVALRDVSATRQVLTVKTGEGTIVPVTVDLSEGGAIVLPPASLPEALELAQAIASGREPHLAVAAQLAILSNAVISMAAGVIPQGVAHA